MEPETTQIQIYKDTRRYLKDRGKKGESYDTIIRRLLGIEGKGRGS